MNKFQRFYGSVKNKAAVVGASVLGLSTQAHAAMDTTAVTAALTDAGTAAAVVGAAVLVVLVGIKAFKYVRAAM